MQIASRTPTPAAPAAGTPAPSAWRRRLRLAGHYGEYVLGGATIIGMALSIWAAFILAPTDAVQGDAQRIFYFHVPMAWVAYLAFFIVFVASILYLWRGAEQWDWLARAAAELGTLFTTLVLIAGSIWGKVIWGTWWQWDPRLTTTLILWFIYVGYLLLRSYTGRSAGGARAAAVLGIVGFIDVPIDYLSVTWWRSLHPASTYVIEGGSSQLPPAALLAFMLALVTFTLFFAFLLILVYRLQRAQSQVQRLRAHVDLE